MSESVDIRDQAYFEVVDTYTKDGRHLGSVAKTPDGRIVWEEGRMPSKDVCFVPHINAVWPWDVG